MADDSNLLVNASARGDRDGYKTRVQATYKRLIKGLYPRRAQGTEKSLRPVNVTRLTNYATRYPKKLPMIGRYFEARIKSDLRKQRFGFVQLAMEALSELIAACYQEMSLALIEGHVTSVISLLLCHESPDMKCVAASTFVEYANSCAQGVNTGGAGSDPASFNLFVKPLLDLCSYEAVDEVEECKVRVEGLQALVRLVLYMATVNAPAFVRHMKEIIRVVLINMRYCEGRGMEEEVKREEEDDDAKEQVRLLARECLTKIASVTNPTSIHHLLYPIFAHLDNSLWEPMSFAIESLRMIAVATQSLYDYNLPLFHHLLRHLSSKDFLDTGTTAAQRPAKSAHGKAALVPVDDNGRAEQGAEPNVHQLMLKRRIVEATVQVVSSAGIEIPVDSLFQESLEHLLHQLLRSADERAQGHSRRHRSSAADASELAKIEEAIIRCMAAFAARLPSPLERINMTSFLVGYLQEQGKSAPPSAVANQEGEHRARSSAEALLERKAVQLQRSVLGCALAVAQSQPSLSEGPTFPGHLVLPLFSLYLTSSTPDLLQGVHEVIIGLLSWSSSFSPHYCQYSSPPLLLLPSGDAAATKTGAHCDGDGGVTGAADFTWNPLTTAHRDALVATLFHAACQQHPVATLAQRIETVFKTFVGMLAGSGPPELCRSIPVVFAMQAQADKRSHGVTAEQKMTESDAAEHARLLQTLAAAYLVAVAHIFNCERLKSYVAAVLKRWHGWIRPSRSVCISAGGELSRIPAQLLTSAEDGSTPLDSGDGDGAELVRRWLLNDGFAFGDDSPADTAAVESGDARLFSKTTVVELLSESPALTTAWPQLAAALEGSVSAPVPPVLQGGLFSYELNSPSDLGADDDGGGIARNGDFHWADGSKEPELFDRKGGKLDSWLPQGNDSPGTIEDGEDGTSILEYQEVFASVEVDIHTTRDFHMIHQRAQIKAQQKKRTIDAIMATSLPPTKLNVATGSLAIPAI